MGAVLHLAHGKEVIQSVSGFFLMAEHHGCGGAQAQLVGFFHNAEPLLGSAFVGRNLGAYARVQNFRPAAGQRLQASFFQTAQHFRYGKAEFLGPEENLRR